MVSVPYRATVCKLKTRILQKGTSVEALAPFCLFFAWFHQIFREGDIETVVVVMNDVDLFIPATN